MNKQPDWRSEVEEPKIVDQADYIISELGKGRDGKVIKVVPFDGGIGYMYAEGEILVRDEYLEQVLVILEHPRSVRELQEADPGPLVQPVIEGITLLTSLGDHYPEVIGTPERPGALDVIDQRLGDGVATPNQVMTVAGGHGTPCPATEPEEVYDGIEPFPSVCHGNGGEGVLIYIADTGLLREAEPAADPGWMTDHRWLAGVKVEKTPEDLDPHNPLTGSPPKIPAYTGHGTFVAGVARCMAPAAEVIVTNECKKAGSTLESDLVPRLRAAIGLGVDIFHLAVAAPSRKDLPYIAVEKWLQLLREHTSSVCVSPAGNSGVRRLTWPGAFPDVVAVGALGGDWRGRASFSNHGGWVDVYTPGRDLINAYATGRYKCHWAPYKNDERNFYGMAKWSGTSFSSPIMTGLIAARMSSTGENGRQAAAALLAEARARTIPGVGPVLLPCCGRADSCHCCRGADPRPCCQGAAHQPCCR